MKPVLIAALGLAISLPAVAVSAHAATRNDATSHRHQPRAHHYQYRANGPADPSFDRYGRRYRPTVSGPCMVDLGYGRFARCDGAL